MAEILHEVTIAAPPDKICRAITERQGIAGWWTPEVNAEPRVGSVAEMRFGGGRFVIRMEITGLEPGRQVQWAVQSGAPEWSGTRVTWILTPAGSGTGVRFGHHDFASTEGEFAAVSYNWAWYLTRLKEYLETGTGRPGQLPQAPPMQPEAGTGGAG